MSPIVTGRKLKLITFILFLSRTNSLSSQSFSSPSTLDMSLPKKTMTVNKTKMKKSTKQFFLFVFCIMLLIKQHELSILKKIIKRYHNNYKLSIDGAE